MDIIEQVFDLAEKALSKEPFYVTINNEMVDKLGNEIKESEKIIYVKNEVRLIDILKELVASSINYCYWYGTSDIRPNNNSSTSMYECVETAFGNGYRALKFENRIDHLIDILSFQRFPFLEERKRHLLELCEDRKSEEFARMILNPEKYTGESLFNYMISKFQGFASDMFLKRASLFFMQLYRYFGMYEDLMYKLFVPADYQVPKILKYFKCIEYNIELETMIKNNILIPKNSLMEIQIRAATIKVCKMLQDISEWNAADIDTFLWGNRKLTNEAFHLTYTTDY